MKTKRTQSARPIAVDLFCGCGGLSSGLRAAGFHVKGAIDIDTVALNTYRRNHRSVLVSAADIRDIAPVEWMKSLNLVEGQLDLLAGCPPCQGFSVLRTKNGSKQNRDAQNALVSQMLRFASVFMPKAIMMENVPGLKDHRLFRTFTTGLRKLGYLVRHTVADVRNFGVPQRRRRLIMLAGRGFKLEFAPHARRAQSVRDAIAHLPLAGNSGDVLHDYKETRAPRTKRLIARIPKDGGGRLDLPLRDQLPCHRKSDGYKDIYGRMSWDGVAPTITTGCYNPSKGRFLHPSEDRCITMREAALLQSFPVKFNVADGTTKTQAAKMLGNALPPEFIRRHALQVRRAIAAAGADSLRDQV